MNENEITPGYKVKTTDDALQVMAGLIMELRCVRAECNAEREARAQRKLYERLLLKEGAALGHIVAWHRTGLLSDIAYNALREEILAVLAAMVLPRSG